MLFPVTNQLPGKLQRTASTKAAASCALFFYPGGKKNGTEKFGWDLKVEDIATSASGFE